MQPTRPVPMSGGMPSRPESGRWCGRSEVSHGLPLYARERLAFTEDGAADPKQRYEPLKANSRDFRLGLRRRSV